MVLKELAKVDCFDVIFYPLFIYLFIHSNKLIELSVKNRKEATSIGIMITEYPDVPYHRPLRTTNIYDGRTVFNEVS